MTDGVNTQHDPRVRAGAMGVPGTPPAGSNDHQNRRLSVEFVGSMEAANPEDLGFLGGGRYDGGRETRRCSRAEIKWELSDKTSKASPSEASSC